MNPSEKIARFADAIDELNAKEENPIRLSNETIYIKAILNYLDELIPTLRKKE